ncbi:hypothetical protein DFH28DRAFT_879391 [Melampsora americana]|nr:hypothetical protein DFH28DRAFT_879391 [Melampsora americana]
MLLKSFIASLTSVQSQILETLKIEDLIQFFTLASDLIVRNQQGMNLCPEFLPYNYFSASLPSRLHPFIDILWKNSFSFLAKSYIDAPKMIAHNGIPPKLPDGTMPLLVPYCFLLPPISRSRCPQFPNNNKLEVSTLSGFLYDLTGIHTIQHSLYHCRGISQREELGVFQVHAHYYMTFKLANHFRQCQMLMHASIFNLVNLYNDTYNNLSELPENLGFGPSLSESVCKDGMTIVDLLFLADEQSQLLVVPNGGLDSSRYKLAQDLYSSENYSVGSAHRNHACSLCVSETTTADRVQLIRAIVTDGVTLGFRRCSASEVQRKMVAKEIDAEEGDSLHDGPCKRPLLKITDRFCPYHYKYLHNVCQAQPCIKPTIPGTKTCHLESHILADQKFTEQGNSNFQLSAMLTRPNSSLPIDPTVYQDPVTTQFQDYETIKMGNESNRSEENARDGGASKKSKEPQMSRKRTHNDQVIVAPCGIILARQTMFNAEAVSAVKVLELSSEISLFLLDTFPNDMPEVIFYDNACKLLQHIFKCPETRDKFRHSIIAVDAFHFKSHSDKDCFCRSWTDPNIFPQLQDNQGKWRFNSSAAEVANIWYGAFASICRGMTSIEYHFFLNGMVRRRNNWLCAKLMKRPDVSWIGRFYQINLFFLVSAFFKIFLLSRRFFFS